ncbi:hypothetical protein GGH96_001252 [Coemansia sp. RSA 1972]|nr:hypothetical protein GGH96_001252 [Coemansia sp. RSA 1972]
MPSTAIVERIDRCFLNASGDTGWEVSVAHRILRCFRGLAIGLDRVQASGRSWQALDRCQAERGSVEDSIAALLETLDAARDTRTANNIDAAHNCVCSSRQAAKSLRNYVVSLASSASLDDVDEGMLEALTNMLQQIAVEISQLHAELCDSSKPPADHLVCRQQTTTEQHPLVSESTRAAQDALSASTSLASMLRVFVKTTHQSWALTRTQLAHTPSVPSPLSTASALHRRWVSEEIENESTADPNNANSLDPSRATGSLHARNCSDSRIQATGPHGAPLLRKSALSLHRTSPQSQADAAERAKQVRFQPLVEGPQVDQTRVNELAQLLAQFDAAIASLAVVVQGSQGTDESVSSTYTQAVKGLVTAFVQISRLSSTSGLVKHYDKAALAQFKTTTMAVKQLMVHP